MDTTEWDALSNMHKELSTNHIASYDTTYLERYVELFTKSLQGKGNSSPDEHNWVLNSSFWVKCYRKNKDVQQPSL